MPASEIDDIFSGKTTKIDISAEKSKGKDKVKEINGSAGKSSKKSKKRKRGEADALTAGPAKAPKNETKAEKKRSASKPPENLERVETVRDPSSTTSLAAVQPRPKDRSKFSLPKDVSVEGSRAKSKNRSEKEDLHRFVDSRGSGPRRRTDEGFLVYKEDELGISHEGGDTPLCPFDCDCCF